MGVYCKKEETEVGGDCMVVMGVDSTLHAESIYAFANSRNRGNGSVSPVTPVSPVVKLRGDEDRIKLAVSGQGGNDAFAEDERVAFKEQANLAESYKSQNVVQYDMANPYEMARMSIENSLLSGLHFDMLA